jgi:HK97 family phage prohead protease
MSSNGILFKQNPGQININEAEGIVECFVAGIGNKDSVGDICAPGAFSASLRRRTPRVVWGHDWNQPIGKVLDIYEVGPNDPRLPKKMREAGIGGLYARVQFNLKSERGREAFASITFFGMDQEWSIGYKTLDAVYDNARQANILKEVELYEVSPVLHGANQLTGTISIKSEEQEKAADNPCWDGYQQVGMKPGKNGQMVPNCVPIDPETKASEKQLKDPDGGLTAAGRAYFKRTQGANLKPGVKGPADTPTKMRRKGSFLTRFFTNPSGPLVDEKGRPTRLALSARAWGEPAPKNREDAAELAAKGRRLLERYQNTKKKSDDGEGGEFYDVTSVPEMESYRKRLGRALADEMDAPIKIVSLDQNMVVFEALMDNQKQTHRMSYHHEDGEFMFGRSQRVRPETVYLPYDSDGPAMAFEGDEKSAIEDWLDEMYDYALGDEAVGEKADIDALEAIHDLVISDIEEKAEKFFAGSNIEKLNQAIALLREVVASGGNETIEMKENELEFIIPADKKELFALRQYLDPILEHFDADAECTTYGIDVKSISGNPEAFETAINRALEHFSTK